MRISDWSSDVCSSDLQPIVPEVHLPAKFAPSHPAQRKGEQRPAKPGRRHCCRPDRLLLTPRKEERSRHCRKEKPAQRELGQLQSGPPENGALRIGLGEDVGPVRHAEQRAVHCISRSEEHTSELQSLMRISYAVFCLQKKTSQVTYIIHN